MQGISQVYLIQKNERGISFFGKFLYVDYMCLPKLMRGLGTSVKKFPN